MNMMDCANSPKHIAKLGLRISLGLAVALIGIDHLLNIGEFPQMVAAGLGPLEPAGLAWGYILPFLELVGGLMVAFNFQPDKGMWLFVIALGSIVVGMVLKGILASTTLVSPDEAFPLDSAMGIAQATSLWLIGAVLASSCCGGGAAEAKKTVKKKK
jgi:hypothetical protein